MTNNDADDPRGLDQAELDARIVELFDQDESLRAISRKVGVSWRQVRRALNDAGLSLSERTTRNEAARERIKADTQTRLESVRSQRVELAELLMEDALRMRERVWDQYVTHIVTEEGPVEVLLDEPPLKEQNDGSKAIATMVDTVDKLLEGIDTREKEESHSVLSNLMAGLAAVVDNDPTLGLDEQDIEPDYVEEEED